MIGGENWRLRKGEKAERMPRLYRFSGEVRDGDEACESGALVGVCGSSIASSSELVLGAVASSVGALF